MTGQLTAKKNERDLGLQLRIIVKKAFDNEEFQTDPERCDRNYLSLKRIKDNYIFNKYKRSIFSSATGFSSEDCSLVISTEFLEKIRREENPSK